MRFLARLAAAVLASAPLHAADARPDWLSGQSAEYPTSAYVIGVGQGPSQEKAADKARADLAKSLSMSIEATTHSNASESTDGRSSSYSQDVSDDVRTSTNKVLDGVTIAKYWQGSDDYYALAVLDRAHSLKIFRDKLEEFDRDFATAQGQLDKLDGKFARLRVALKLTRIARDRRRLNADYRILNPEAQGLPAPAGAADAVAKARKAVSAITFQVAADGPQPDKLQARIIDGLSSLGLKAVEKSDKACDVVLEAKADAAKLAPEDLTWFWAKGTIIVKLSYGSTGEVFSRFEESGQEAARDPDSSIDAVIARLGDQAAAHSFKTILTAQLADD